MTIYRLNQYDWDSCGEHKSVQDSWYYMTREKAQEHKNRIIAEETRHINFNSHLGPNWAKDEMKRIDNDLIISEVKVVE